MTSIISSLADALNRKQMEDDIADPTNDINSQADYVETLLNSMYDTYLAVKEKE